MHNHDDKIPLWPRFEPCYKPQSIRAIGVGGPTLDVKFGRLQIVSYKVGPRAETVK